MPVGPGNAVLWVEYGNCEGRSLQRFSYKKTLASPSSLSPTLSLAHLHWRKPAAMLWAALGEARTWGWSLANSPRGPETCHQPREWPRKSTLHWWEPSDETTAPADILVAFVTSCERPRGRRPDSAMPRFLTPRNKPWGTKCVWLHAPGFGAQITNTRIKHMLEQC